MNPSDMISITEITKLIPYFTMASTTFLESKLIELYHCAHYISSNLFFIVITI